ncbi:MAG: sugar ABC transporter permease [Candidatus Atribacteria bacterium]|nr:sugar ABC transporter permease [Candidatus Atribacteria bacterium]
MDRLFGKTGIFNREARTAWLFMLPALVGAGVFLIYPILDAFRLSFTDYVGFRQPNFVGLDNYVSLFTDPDFWHVLAVTFEYTVVVVLANTVLAFFEALLFNRAVVGKQAFRAICYIPVVTSFVLVSTMWKFIFHTKGLLNNLLAWLGILGTGESIHWLLDPKLALWAVAMVTIWRAVSYYAIIYLAGLQSIPTELVDAARVDGASSWQVTRHITIPLIRPYMIVVIVVNSIGAMKVFDEIYIMTGGGPLRSTMALNFLVYQEGFTFFHMGLASAAGIVLLVIVLLISIVNITVLERGTAEIQL